MGFLSGSDALIVDLRDNGGGDPTMIQLIVSYLVSSEPIHFSSVPVGERTQGAASSGRSGPLPGGRS
jgi:C-terminal processing protease CtpA/Prc